MVIWIENNLTECGNLNLEKKLDTAVTVEVEQMISKLFESPKKGNDFLGKASSILASAPVAVNLILLANSRGNIDNEKVTTLLSTLRDQSRIGFMVGFVTLIRMALNGDKAVQQQAKKFIPLYFHAKYKSKNSQVFLLVLYLYQI